MNPLQSFLSVSLPIMVTLIATVWIAQWSQNKQFDTLNGRFTDMNRRLDEFRAEFKSKFAEILTWLDRIEMKLDNHEARIVRLEERTSIIR